MGASFARSFAGAFVGVGVFLALNAIVER